MGLLKLFKRTPPMPEKIEKGDRVLIRRVISKEMRWYLERPIIHHGLFEAIIDEVSPLRRVKFIIDGKAAWLDRGEYQLIEKLGEVNHDPV